MAQTKKKRRSKHRGTAAGTVQARGRTSRPGAGQAKAPSTAAEKRLARMNRPPTWKGSLQRASLAAVVIFVFLLVTAKKDNVTVAILFSLLSLLIYVPLGYQFETYMYKRRVRKGLVK